MCPSYHKRSSFHSQPGNECGSLNLLLTIRANVLLGRCWVASIQIQHWSSVSESTPGGCSSAIVWDVGVSSCRGVNNGQTLVGVMSSPDPGCTSERWVSAS